VEGRLHKFYNIYYPNMCMMVKVKSLRQSGQPELKNQPSPLPARIKQIWLTSSCCVSQSLAVQLTQSNKTQNLHVRFFYFLLHVPVIHIWPWGRESTGRKVKVPTTKPPFQNQFAENTLDITSKERIINRNNKNLKIHRIFP
jgi:hypothetical protein